MQPAKDTPQAGILRFFVRGADYGEKGGKKA